MKKFIVNLFIVATLLTGLSAFTFAKTTSSAAASQPASTESAGRSFSSVYRVRGYYENSHRFYFRAGETVDVSLSGDGDTDLDLYIYDMNGSLVAKRTGSSDDESASLDVYRSGYFTVKVVNSGEVYNDYVLSLDTY